MQITQQSNVELVTCISWNYWAKFLQYFCHYSEIFSALFHFGHYSCNFQLCIILVNILWNSCIFNFSYWFFLTLISKFLQVKILNSACYFYFFRTFWTCGIKTWLCHITCPEFDYRTHRTQWTHNLILASHPTLMGRFILGGGNNKPNFGCTP